MAIEILPQYFRLDPLNDPKINRLHWNASKRLIGPGKSVAGRGDPNQGEYTNLAIFPQTAVDDDRLEIDSSHPGYVASRAYPFFRTTNKRGLLQVGNVYYSPFRIVHQVSVSGLCLFVTASAPNSVARLALFANLAGRPGQLLVESQNDVSTSTTGLKEDYFPVAVVLNTGWYWGAVAVSGGTPEVPVFSTTEGEAELASLVGSVSGNGVFSPSGQLNRVVQSGVTFLPGFAFMPQTATGLTIDSTPNGSPVLGFVTSPGLVADLNIRDELGNPILDEGGNPILQG